ncbi:hypothetical protein [Burkholderia cepacia]|uniref:hypothetical protein n=1 Tax=Burkholderia cepacia TaxID=292 RepID=UPI001CF273E1|nr:hypothetical protein [Burkholderia cepacia]MCA8024511.1 hypothetical protein [Burkholderia cepacia]
MSVQYWIIRYWTSKERRFHGDNRHIAVINSLSTMPSTLMIHPTMPERRVKLGFNWSALIFGTIWAYSEGLVVQGGRMAAVDAASGLLCSFDRPALLITALILFVAKNIYSARHGSAWVCQRLLNQGYRALQ